MFRAMTAIGAALLLAACVACGGTDSGNESDVVTTDVTPVDVIEAATDTVPEIVLDTIVKTDTVKPEAVIQETTEVADVPAGCPAAVISGPTCGEIGACALQCTDAAFQAQCIAQGEQAAKDAFAAVQTCLATAACATLWVNDDFSECAKGACADKLSACFVGTMTCKDVWTCRKGCDPEDTGCPIRCLAEGAPNYQAVWLDYKNCALAAACAQNPANLRGNGWPTDQCEGNADGTVCHNQYMACVPIQ